MTWNTLTNLAAGVTVTETHMDDIRENIEHAGDNVVIGGVDLKTLTTPTSAARLATGTYTGDGAATQAITGVGFQPDFMIVYHQAEYSSASELIKSDQDGTKTGYHSSAQWEYEDDHIISLNADGFTVGDGTGGSFAPANINLTVYAYIAWKA